MLTSSPKTSNNAIKIDDGTFTNYNWTIAGGVTYTDVINYDRVGKKQSRHCVMCGLMEDGHKCKIPNQNKDVCRICDSTYWFLNGKNVLVKFCKGCKTFFPLMNYDDKPEASKCGSCRRRGRDNYYFKKEKDANTTTTTTTSTAATTIIPKKTSGIGSGSGSSVVVGHDKGGGEDKYVESLKRMRANTLSPEEFCTLVNTMTKKDDEGIDVQTLLEYGSTDFTYEIDDFRDNSHTLAEPMFVFKDTHEPQPMSFSPEHCLMTNDDGYDDEFAQIWDNDKDDDDEMMQDMFAWLPELIISPPLSPTCSV